MELQPIELDIDDGTEVAYDQVLREIFEGYFTREGRATNKHVTYFILIFQTLVICLKDR